MIEPLELIASDEEELRELVEFCRAADLEVLVVIVLAVPAQLAPTNGDVGAAA